MALNKLCKIDEKFILPQECRLLFRIHDQKTLKSQFLPGLMMFIDDFAIELDEQFTENLMPGEIDLTRYLENMNKFKLEIYWNEAVSNQKIFGWCMFVAMRRQNERRVKMDDDVLNGSLRK